jgi:excisionase family DNA binding protein
LPSIVTLLGDARMSSRSTDILNATASFEPLVVTPRQACKLLGIGNTHLYRLLGAKELESYTDGRARRIPLSSIRSYVARRIEASMGPRPKRRGRPPKIEAQPGATT